MNHHSIAHGSIVGIVAAVPDNIITNADCPDPAGADEAAKLTGVRERRWVKPGQTARTLCTDAARRLLDRMDWKAGELDLIVYVTQTPERAVPADVYTIAADLGATCPCVQPNYSCAGYVYGLWMAMKLIEAGQRALLLVGDANSTLSDPGDRATAPLFGDAGSATAIVGGGPEQHFFMGTDGTGAEKLCTVLDYGWPQDGEGDTEYLKMDGAAVFNFTLKRVPPLVDAIREIGVPDVWYLHQANRMILNHLGKKCGILSEFVDPFQRPVPMNIERFGNCSCASIPLLMCTTVPAMSPIGFGPVRFGLVGYGAGFAWCGANLAVETGFPVQCIDV